MSDTGFDERLRSPVAWCMNLLPKGWVNIVGGCCGTTPDHVAPLPRRSRCACTQDVFYPAEVLRKPGL